MKVLLLPTCYIAVIAVALVGVGDAVVIPQAEAALLMGGCTVTAYSDCGTMQNGSESCRVCALGNKCDNSHVNEMCTSLTGKGPEECVKCGTCLENCGGSKRIYDDDDDNCTEGTWTTDSCYLTWTDAEEGNCSVACE